MGDIIDSNQWGLPLMMSTKILDFFDQPYTLLELVCNIKYTQPLLICPLLHDPPPPRRTSYLEAPTADREAAYLLRGSPVGLLGRPQVSQDLLGSHGAVAVVVAAGACDGRHLIPRADDRRPARLLVGLAAPEAAALVAVLGPQDGAVLSPPEAHLLHHYTERERERRSTCVSDTYTWL